jgi:hypothetical protein
MGFRSQKKANFEKFEIETLVEHMGDAFEGACTVLEEKGLDTNNADPEVTIILNNGTQGDSGKRLTTCIIYVGATPEQVTNDLFIAQQK